MYNKKNHQKPQIGIGDTRGMVVEEMINSKGFSKLSTNLKRK